MKGILNETWAIAQEHTDHDRFVPHKRRAEIMTVADMIGRLSHMPQEAHVIVHAGTRMDYILPFSVQQLDDTHVQIAVHPEVDAEMGETQNGGYDEE